LKPLAKPMLKPYILVIDDEPDIRQLVKEILEDEGYNVEVARDGAAARDVVAAKPPGLILLDIWMPDIDGISLLKEFIEAHKLQCPVVMMSGHGTVEAAVEATRLGAYDFIEKPLSLSKLLMTVERALASDQSRSRAVGNTHEKLEPVEIVGKSEMARTLQHKLQQCAQHDVTVLILAETGAGKGHCARYIHTHSRRSEGPFIEMHTATLVSSHAGSMAELLLGTVVDGRIHAGFLEQAHGGTLYIDDVAELDSKAQAGLYGVLISPSYFRIDDDEAVTTDVRVITASRYDLEQEVRAGRFREDLYHSLKGFPVTIVPLREHSEDISELLHHYVRRFSDREGLPYRDFSLAAQNRLRNYDWPGNILELENLVRRLLIGGGREAVELEEIEQALTETAAEEPALSRAQPPEFSLPLRQAREQFERAYLEFHLRKSHGSVGKVAKMAGMERTHLYRKLRSLGIDTKH